MPLESIRAVGDIYWLLLDLLLPKHTKVNTVTQHLWCSQENVWLKNVCNLTKQAATACRTFYNHNHFKMSQLTQCCDSSTLWAPLKTVCKEERGQLLSGDLFLLLSYPLNLDQILYIESFKIKHILLILCIRRLNNLKVF